MERNTLKTLAKVRAHLEGKLEEEKQRQGGIPIFHGHDHMTIAARIELLTEILGWMNDEVYDLAGVRLWNEE